MKRLQFLESFCVFFFVACAVTPTNEKKSPPAEEKQPSATVTSSPASTATMAPGPASAPVIVDMKKYPGTPEGAKALLSDILISKAEALALTAQLKPTKADFEAVFTSDFVETISKYYEERDAKRTEPALIDPKYPTNTNLLFAQATAEELNDKARPVEDFPGGYERIAGKFKPGFIWYRWKYTEPGKTIGMAYDGLVYVNGRWVWFPKPWKSLGGPE
jgi:hypothetical protein